MSPCFSPCLVTKIKQCTRMVHLLCITKKYTVASMSCMCTVQWSLVNWCVVKYMIERNVHESHMMNN
jgi:hypothetical protein